MQLSDISQDASIQALQPEFAAKGIPFQPSLESAFSEATGREGVQTKELIIRAVVNILRECLREKLNKPPKTNAGFFRALLVMIFGKGK